MIDIIKKLVEEHQFFRRTYLCIVGYIIIFDNYQMFRDGGFLDRGLVTGPVATAFGGVLGLLGTVIGWQYFKNRSISQRFDYSEERREEM